MFQLSRASYRNLDGVHPDLVKVVERAIQITPVDFKVIEGVRSLKRQRELKARGKSRTLRSRHLVQSDGWGHAVDVMAVGDLNRDGVVDHKDKSITWDRQWYGKIAEAMLLAAGQLGVKVSWGGAWKSFYDGPHFQLEGQSSP